MKKIVYLLIIFGTIGLFSPESASADLGPKPSVKIDVVYYGENIPVAESFSAKMLECIPQDQKQNRMKDKTVPQLEINEYDSSKNCYWVPAWLAGGGQCSNSSCDFGYMLPNNFKLAVFIPSTNKVFVTNEISRSNFNSNYKAVLFSDGSAKISETTRFLAQDKVSSFAKAFSITIILELLVSLIFLSVRRLPKKILTYILLANIISLPIVWFLFPLIKLSTLSVIIASEVFAVLFETLFVYLLNKQIISFKQSLMLNILNNAVSLFVGGFVYMFIGSFI